MKDTRREKQTELIPIDGFECGGDFGEARDFGHLIDELGAIEPLAKLPTVKAHAIIRAQHATLLLLLKEWQRGRETEKKERNTKKEENGSRR